MPQMTARSPHFRSPGLYTAEQIREGEPYELSNGRLIHCESGGGRHGAENAIGASVLGSDPEAKEVGVDTGFTWAPKMLRAPDVAVGNVPNKPGWVKGAPHLALEYADVGQDEGELRQKIQELLEAGTRYLWVVRLTGPRRVEVFERGKAPRIVVPGEVLTAPGVLKNPVPVDALYDRDAADRVTLTNLLQRQGFEDLEAVLAKGRDEGLRAGRDEGLRALRAAVRSLCRVLSIPLAAERDAQIERMDAADLDALRERIERDRRWE
jgi:Uma2 family endonuclease